MGPARFHCATLLLVLDYCKIWAFKEPKINICQKWDSNPRPQKWTATWTQRLRPLGHPDLTNLKFTVYWIAKSVVLLERRSEAQSSWDWIFSGHPQSLPGPGQIFKNILPDRESNPGLPRDRRRSSPLDYRGCDVGSFTKKQTRTIFIAGDYRKI